MAATPDQPLAAADMEVPKTDLQKFLKYLEDSAELYEALAALPMQKCSCRAHMIRQLINKYKQKLKER